MKKIAITLIAGIFIAIAASSCKSHETCPAYGKTEFQASSLQTPS